MKGRLGNGVILFHCQKFHRFVSLDLFHFSFPKMTMETIHSVSQILFECYSVQLSGNTKNEKLLPLMFYCLVKETNIHRKCKKSSMGVEREWGGGEERRSGKLGVEKSK